MGQELALNISQKTGNQNKSKSTSLPFLRTVYGVELKWTLKSACFQASVTTAN